MNETDRVEPDKVTYSYSEMLGYHKFRITMWGKTYKMLLTEDTLDSLEVTPGQTIYEVVRKEV